jgi:hypothetical protein
MSPPLPILRSAVEIAQEESASPEQVVASALAFYSALPRPLRTAALARLQVKDAGAHAALVNELVRALVGFELRERRENIHRLAASGEIAGLPAMSDEAAGEEAVRLVEESRAGRTPARG